jgi:predicted nucleotidyltransferase
MFLSSDMKDLIEIMHKKNVAYALVGGFAVNYYGYIRTTQDIDFLIYPSPDNADKMMEALSMFGFGEAGIPREYFTREGAAIHIGVEPNRIDFLTSLKGLNNDTIFRNLQDVEIDNITVKIISLADLIQVKKYSQRLKDRADAEELEKNTTHNRI